MNNMNLYLISQEVNNDYDTFDSAVVVAASEEEARNMYPGTDDGSLFVYKYAYGREETEDPTREWALPKDVQVEYLGIAASKYLSKAVICASYNAG